MVNVMPETERCTVLVIEDDERVARSFCRVLGLAGYATVSAGSVAAARACIAGARSEGASCYSVVLLDLKLPDGDGEDLIVELKALLPEPAVAVISGTADGERALRLLSQGIWVLPKPIDGKALVALVARLCSRPAPVDSIGAYCRAYGLSPKETEVLRASAEGLSSAETSERVGCSVHTTTAYWQRIFHKTGRRSRPAVFAAILAFAVKEPQDPNPPKR